jgi:hypothetical protein
MDSYFNVQFYYCFHGFIASFLFPKRRKFSFYFGTLFCKREIMDNFPVFFSVVFLGEIFLFFIVCSWNSLFIPSIRTLFLSSQLFVQSCQNQNQYNKYVNFLTNFLFSVKILRKNQIRNSRPSLTFSFSSNFFSCVFFWCFFWLTFSQEPHELKEPQVKKSLLLQ